VVTISQNQVKSATRLTDAVTSTAKPRKQDTNAENVLKSTGAGPNQDVTKKLTAKPPSTNTPRLRDVSHVTKVSANAKAETVLPSKSNIKHTQPLHLPIYQKKKRDVILLTFFVPLKK